MSASFSNGGSSTQAASREAISASEAARTGTAEADASVPNAEADVSVPNAEADVSVPGVTDADASVPGVREADASVPNAEADASVPGAGEADASVPGVTEADASVPNVMDALAESVAMVKARTASGGPIVELQEYVDLQEQIVDADARAGRAAGEGIRARWEFGKLLLRERYANGGKQLPNGRMAEIVEATDLSRADIARRMQFAEKYPTEEQVAQACATYPSWTQIVSKALPTRSASKNANTDPFATRPVSALTKEVLAKEVGDALTRMDAAAARIRRVREDRQAPTLAAIFTELRSTQVDDRTADQLVRIRRELYALGRASMGDSDDHGDIRHVIDVVVTEARTLSGDLPPEVRARAAKSLREVADLFDANPKGPRRDRKLRTSS
jgi:hypothetical protein